MKTINLPNGNMAMIDERDEAPEWEMAFLHYPQLQIYQFGKF